MMPKTKKLHIVSWPSAHTSPRALFESPVCGEWARKTEKVCGLYTGLIARLDHISMVFETLSCHAHVVDVPIVQYANMRSVE